MTSTDDPSNTAVEAPEDPLAAAYRQARSANEKLAWLQVDEAVGLIQARYPTATAVVLRGYTDELEGASVSIDAVVGPDMQVIGERGPNLVIAEDYLSGARAYLRIGDDDVDLRGLKDMTSSLLPELRADENSNRILDEYF